MDIGSGRNDPPPFSFYAFLYRRTHVDFAEVFEREHQRVGSATAMPERLDGLVELVHQRETGQYESHAFRFLQREAHVLDEMLDKESRVEVAL